VKTVKVGFAAFGAAGEISAGIRCRRRAFTIAGFVES